MQQISRLALLALGLCAVPLLGGCDSGASAGGEGGEGGGGGTGGVGGSAGDAEEREALCRRSCEVVVPCTRDYAPDENEACLAGCMEAEQPVSLLESCVSCLEETACIGATLGCQRGPACEMSFDLRVHGAGFDGLDGSKVRVLAVEAYEGESWIDTARDGVIEGGAIDLRIAKALPSWGVPYDVVVLVDVDGDGACKPGSADRAWRFGLGLPTGNVEITVDPAAAQTPADCTLWAVPAPTPVLEGRGLDAWNGKTAIAAPIWIDSDFLTVGLLKSAPIENGSFRVELGDFGDKVDEMAPDSEVRMIWMVDLDGDWICSEADAGGNELVPPVSGIEQRVEAGPSAVGSAPCELLRGTGHDVNLSGRGYGPYEGVKVEGVLVDENGRVAARAQNVVTDGVVQLGFPRIAVPGRSYVASVWADVDGDHACEVPVDAAWSFDLGTIDGAAERSIDLPATEPSGELCPLFNMKN